MNFSSNKKRLLFSILFFATSLVALFFNLDVFIIDEEPVFYNETYIGLCSFFGFLTSLLILFKFEFNNILNKIFSVVVFILAAVSTFFTVELFNGTNLLSENNGYYIPALLVLLNFIIIFVFSFMLFVITNSFKVSSILSCLTLNVLSIINYFVTLFRGQPLVPWDIYSVATAVSVANTYKPEFTPLFILGIFIIIFTLGLISKFNFKLKINKKNIIIRGIISIILITLVVLFYVLDVITIFNMKVSLWEPINEYHRNGFLVSFFKQSKNLFISNPDGYSITNLKNKYSNNKTDLENIKQTPNIIAIMNESFADLSILGNVETNEEYLPFFKSFSENCIKGNLHVSTYGGGTPNTEWEFLTGNSMAFMPTGAVPYQQYLHKKVQSLVKVTQDLNYSNFAMHSYFKKGYRRSSVYPLLGFSEFYDIEKMKELMTYVRYLPSDYGTYLNLFEKLNNRDDKENPQFSFTVTMQNHGAYTYEGDDFDSSIYLENMNGDYPKANQFINLLAYTDESFKYLVEEIEKLDEPTILLFFGDHHPRLEEEFVDEIFSQYENPESLEVQEKKYITPFIIWANYDISEKEVNDISVNYLSTLLFETADLPLTPYMQFLSELRKEIPVITANCYIDKNEIYHTFDEVNEYTDLLKEYEYLVYNNVFDTSHTVNNIFSLK